MFSNFAVKLTLALAICRGQCMRILGPAHENVYLAPYKSYQEVFEVEEDLIRPMRSAQPFLGGSIPKDRRNRWKLICSSVDITNDCEKAMDNDNATFWQSSPSIVPHTLTIELGDLENVNAISVTPGPTTAGEGGLTGHRVLLSKDGISWGDPVAYGTWRSDNTVKWAIFEPQPARFVRLESVPATTSPSFIRLAEFDIWATDLCAAHAPVLGKWGPTIDFPIVPVGAFVDPLSGNVVTFSSNEHRGFGNANPSGVTFTATWDFASKKVVSQARVDKTQHDMFCPGMAFDVNGRMIITGGKTQKKTSVYDPKLASQEPWKPLAPMKRSRGYQGSTTTSNGNIFVIGGSWSLQNANTGGRDGEIYDPTSDKWSPLENCHAKDIQMTEDWEDIKLHSSYRSDNHVWLLGWKNNAVFHAGPAKDLHWITTTNSGDIKPAGRRGNDRDAMCGSAVMYNATEGKILTMGGAPNYKYFDDSDKSNIKEAGQKASRNAFIITLGDINAPVSVEKAGDNMSFNRTFHHSVVLPTGETFVVGGQLIGEGFTDQTPVLDPEIYSPVGNQWRTVAPHSIVRVYHSFALLLPDATVLVGGGGLCGDCGVNHPDAQIYTPAYLLESRGGLATRPVITNWPATAPAVLPGATLTITTDTDVVSASLIRYGGATHSLNNDQRRIELKLVTKAARQYAAALPDNGGIAIPGYYMLFVINADGTPSVAKNVQILVGKK